MSEDFYTITRAKTLRQNVEDSVSFVVADLKHHDMEDEVIKESVDGIMLCVKDRLNNIEKQVSDLQRTLGFVDYSSGVCCCGNDMSNHSPYENHSPVDSGHYAVDRALMDIYKEIENAGT